MVTIFFLENIYTADSGGNKTQTQKWNQAQMKCILFGKKDHDRNIFTINWVLYNLVYPAWIVFMGQFFCRRIISIDPIACRVTGSQNRSYSESRLVNQIMPKQHK